jgi:hypothetical protein
VQALLAVFLRWVNTKLHWFNRLGRENRSRRLAMNISCDPCNYGPSEVRLRIALHSTQLILTTTPLWLPMSTLGCPYKRLSINGGRSFGKRWVPRLRPELTSRSSEAFGSPPWPGLCVSTSHRPARPLIQAKRWDLRRQ